MDNGQCTIDNFGGAASRRILKLSIFNCQLSIELVGLSGLEPPTSRLSGGRSNRLSYKPISFNVEFGMWNLEFPSSPRCESFKPLLSNLKFQIRNSKFQIE